MCTCLQGKPRAGEAAGETRTSKQQPFDTPKRLAKLQRGAKHAARSDDAVLAMRRLLSTIGCKLFVRVAVMRWQLARRSSGAHERRW